MEKKQTAVDMFCGNITDHIEGIFNGSIQQDEFAKRMRESYNQAKAMEKEQAFEFWQGGINCTEEGGKSFQEYYTKNYGEETDGSSMA
jgi:hypothetical protein